MWNVPLSELQFSRVIGEGSFGKVYLGKWQETTVAIKILTSPGGPLPDDSWDLQDVTQLKDCSWYVHSPDISFYFFLHLDDACTVTVVLVFQ